MRSPAIIAAIAILAGPAFGQGADDLVFEVASVKPSPRVPPNYVGPPRGGPGTADPGRITWTYASLTNLLTAAYDVNSYQISGPDWLGSERYDIHAKVPAGATKEQVRVMWRNLLTERFGLKLHHESREFRVEDLVVAKGGPKLKESAADPTPPVNDEPPRIRNGELMTPGVLLATMTPSANGTAAAHVVARAQPLSKLASMLTNQVHRPVLDKTGLTGNYDFTVDITIRMAGIPVTPAPAADSASASDPGSDIGAALQQQLGLRLIPSKATLDVLIIDKAQEVPTEN